MFTYFFLWFPMVVIAILNGTLRIKFMMKYFDELKAHQFSVLTGITLVAIYIWIVTGICLIESSAQAWMIGFMWLIMTILFEFIFGHYVMKQPWEKLFADYNIFKGRLWVVVLIWVTIAPCLFYYLRS